MAIYFEQAAENLALSQDELREGLYAALEKLGVRKRVLVVPPDISRIHSRAGELTQFAWEYYRDKLTGILPAIGTHLPMTEAEIARMFGPVPRDLFKVHDWRHDIVTLGEVPADFIKRQSEGKLDFTWPAQVNKLIAEGDHDLVLSIGQVVPHEVIGMANYNKNIFVGTGGKEGINRSHYLGAVCGMENIMGRADTPVRRILNYADEHFAAELTIVYVLTVVVYDPATGGMATRGLFVGDDEEVFQRAARLSQRVNIEILEKPLAKVVVYLDPEEFKSTWLGNKAIYRTRMAIADAGELIVLAPGVHRFGEDKTIDSLIRKYGYVGTPTVLQKVADNADLQANLSAAAHLIHGSSEGRFSITYCPAKLTREEIEGVNFRYQDLSRALEEYDPNTLRQGRNVVNGEEVFFISNPGLGLWAVANKFINRDTEQTSQT